MNCATGSMDVLYVPSSDNHNNEYTADYFKCREFISNFNGSAGTALITHSLSLNKGQHCGEARLWTDGRYWCEVGELFKDTSWVLMKQGSSGTISIAKYLANLAIIKHSLMHEANADSTHAVTLNVLFDPNTITAYNYSMLLTNITTEIATIATIDPKALPKVCFQPMNKESNLHEVWRHLHCTHPDVIPPNPVFPSGCKVTLLPEKYNGCPGHVKLNRVVEYLKTIVLTYMGQTKPDLQCLPSNHSQDVYSTITNSYACALYTGLDDIAYLLNLRGSDIEYSPLFYAYLLVTTIPTINGIDTNQKSESIDKPCHYLFIDTEKLNPELTDYLDSLAIYIVQYDIEAVCIESLMPSLYSKVSELMYTNVINRPDHSKVDAKCTLDSFRSLYTIPIVLHPHQLSYRIDAIFKKLSNMYTIVYDLSLPEKLKSVKNSTELEGFEDCHIKDGLAVTKYLAWLDHTFTTEHIKKLKHANDASLLTELYVANRLELFRKESPLYIKPSFATISGTGPNSSIIHYNPAKECSSNTDTSRVLSQGDMYLVDSGGQYYNGTTDVTRTIILPVIESISDDDYVVKYNCSAMQKQHYTLVLKGHISLNMCIYPAFIHGSQLDILARQHLWRIKCDYPHGTSHGVGHYLNVHEGPQSIGKPQLPQVYQQSNQSDVFKYLIDSGTINKPRNFTVLPHNKAHSTLQAGMVISNEPGYYLDGHYGIRIENIDCIVPYNDAKSTNNETFLQFRSLTLVPLCMNLIDVSLLTDVEINWVNAYHAKVKDTLLPLVDDMDLVTKNYILKHTKNI